MALTNQQKTNVENVLRNSLRHKFQNYNPEPASMPFHTRLLGKDRMALFSFIHSLNTNFGTSIFEPVALALASSSFASAESQQTAGTQISSEAHAVIQNIMDSLSTAASMPSKIVEVNAIRAVCRSGEMKTVKPTKVDVKLVARDGTIYLFDIKTAKPNAGGFKEFKRTLLEWVATTLAANPNANIQTIIAIPYNPYEPQPYNRWTMIGVQLFCSANNAPRQTTTCPVILTFKGSSKRLFALRRIPAGAESSAADAKRGTFFASHKKASRQLLCPFVRSFFLCFGMLHPAGFCYRLV